MWSIVVEIRRYKWSERPGWKSFAQMTCFTRSNECARRYKWSERPGWRSCVRRSCFSRSGKKAKLSTMAGTKAKLTTVAGIKAKLSMVASSDQPLKLAKKAKKSSVVAKSRWTDESNSGSSMLRAATKFNKAAKKPGKNAKLCHTIKLRETTKN